MRISEMDVLRNYWYPVLKAADLSDSPTPVTLFGEPWALWRTAAGDPAALANRCPHRAGSLSAGWVSDGHLTCPYHGWQFGPDGRCVHIPHLDEHLPIPPKARVSAGHVEEAYGLIWLCVGTPAAPLPVWREASDPNFRIFVEFHELRETCALRIIDNAIDLSHVTFVHSGTFADPEKLVLPPMPTVESTDNGFLGRFVYDMPGVGEQLGVSAAASTRFERMTEIEVLAPTIVRTRFYFKDFPDQSRDYCFLGAAVPVDDETSIYVRVTALGGTEEDRPYDRFHDFSLRVQEEDAAVLAGTTPDFTFDITDEVHLRIDRLTIEYRKYLARLAAANELVGASPQ